MPDEKKVSWVENLVKQVGFPIVVAGWLLYERWTILQQQSDTLQKLTETINQNSKVVEQLLSKLGG